MSESIVVADPPAELRESVENAVAVAATYGQITCAEQRAAVGNDLKVNKRLQAAVEEERLKIAKPLTEASRAVNALFKKMSTPLEAAELAMKRAAIRWDEEIDRQKMRAYREAARKADEEKARLANEAAAQRTAGNIETAHAIEQAAQFVAPVPVAVPEAIKVDGESTREVWRAVVFDSLALCRAIGDRQVGLSVAETIEIEEFFAKLFGPRARALHDALSIPGVRAVYERVIATRAG